MKKIVKKQRQNAMVMLIVVSVVFVALIYLFINHSFAEVDDVYTMSLLHFDGTNASTSFTDGSLKNWVAHGNAQIDTAQYKFGGASGLFDGNGDYISSADSNDWNFGSGDMSIDFWVKVNTLPAEGSYEMIYSQYQDTANQFNIGIYRSQGLYYWNIQLISAGYQAFGSNITLQTTTLGSNWHHFALIRHGTIGNNWAAYQDGALIGTTWNDSGSAFPDLAGPVYVGSSDGNSNYFNGWIDELRISKGIARWSSSFTPVAGEYVPATPTPTATLTPTPTPTPAPDGLTVSGITPSSGPSAGGTAVTISGSNFISQNFGTGDDGSITVATAKNINTDAIATDRTCADAVNYSVTALSSTSATLAVTPASGCLSAGDEVLLIDQQGTPTYNTNVGNWETLVIEGVDSNTVTFATAKTKYYGNGVSDDTNLGTATTNQRVMLQRVPNYINVTVNTGITMSASAWDGTKGGIFSIRAKGTVAVTGTISMTGKGFRGGTASGGGEPRHAWQGESWTGPGGQSTSANNGGGGGLQSGEACNYPASGGGGYGTAGGNGGGGDCGIPGNGGGTYGSAGLSTLFPGAGGGGQSNYGGTGGSGGGVIYINASEIDVAGSISADGGAGLNAPLGDGPGGGGSGGAIYFTVGTAVLGPSKVTVSGGNGGNDNGPWGDGGAGGYGRIAIYYFSAVTGTTLPSAYQEQQSADSGVLIVSIGGNAANDIIWVNSTTLTAVTTAHSAGIADVKVTNPDQQSMTFSNAFTFIDPPGTFTISPTSAPKTSGTRISINGSNFTGIPTVSFGGAAGTDVVRDDANTIHVTAPAHSPGRFDVVVANPDGQSNTLSKGIAFRDPQPSITEISPDSGTAAGGTAVTISGSNFYSHDFGSGADGTVTVTTNKNINTDIIASARTCADAVNYSVTSLSGNSAVLSTTPAAGCLTGGDEVMLINLQGTAANIVNVGNYEFLQVLSVSSDTITFEAAKTKYYGDGTADDTNIGTTATNQRVMLQRVPNYIDVTINTGITLTADAWDGTKGGVLFFKASGTITNNGNIDLTGKGYRSGVGVYEYSNTNGQGESIIGLGVASAAASSAGGGGGGGSLCGNGNTSGGGGGSYATAGSLGGQEGGSCNRGAGGSNIYGSEILDKLYFGAGGGASYGGADPYRSGGIISLLTRNLINNGSILANGEAGAGTGNNAQGSGAGGSIKITCGAVTAGTISALGGLGFSYYDSQVGYNTGRGGNGRIALYYSDSVSGTTTPAAYQQQFDSTAITVTIGGAAATDVQLSGSASIIATTALHSSGHYDVVVTNYDGQQATLAGGYEYLSANFAIRDLASNLAILNADDWSTDLGATGVPAGSGVTVGITSSNYRIGSFAIVLTDNVDWSGISADSNGSSAFLHFAGGFSGLPGRQSTTYIMYIPVTSGYSRLGICPGAGSLGSVTASCSGFYSLTSGQTVNGVSAGQVSVDSVNYWEVSGLGNSAGLLSNAGYLIINPPAGVSVVAASDNSTQVTTVPQTGSEGVVLKSAAGNWIASLYVTFNDNDKNWSSLNAAASSTKSLFHYPGGISALPGVTGPDPAYDLYVVRGNGNAVLICPGAITLSDIRPGCQDGFNLKSGESQNNISALFIDINGVSYWKLSGLTGTGAMSLISGIQDSATSLQAGTPAVHTLNFGTNNGILSASDNIIISFDPQGQSFDLAALTLTDISLSADAVPLTLAADPGISIWGVNINTSTDTITILAPTAGDYLLPQTQLILTVGGTNQLLNPTLTGSYTISLTINSSEALPEQGIAVIPIVDSDRVDITGSVDYLLVFDIDTGTTDNTDCAYTICQRYEGGAAAANYTVDLGELRPGVISKSQDTAVMHNDDNSGRINSVYLDISTNVPGGASVFLQSANGYLAGPGVSRINAVTDGQNITSNSNSYGYSLGNTGTVNGTLDLNSNCNTANTYCGPQTSLVPILNTNSQPLEAGRVRIDLIAAPNGIDEPGNYSDTLTFIMVANF